jgi:predicted nuclease of predicted toxin-antitoxin system
VKLLLDMNVSPDFVPAIAAHGHDVVHWSIVGDPGATDVSILGWAREHDYVLVTHDLDFTAILAITAATKPSVLQIRQQDLLSHGIVGLLVDAVRLAAPALDAGAVVTIHEDRSRIRVLPLAPPAGESSDESAR